MRIVGVVAVAALAGCATAPDEAAVPDETAAAGMESAAAAPVETGAEGPPPALRPVGGVREVMVPREAAWLAETVTAEYRGVPATVAVREVTRGRPMRLEVAGADPLVHSPPGAVTVQEHVEAICAQADWSWRAAGGVLVIRDIETQTLSIAAQPGSAASSLRLRALSTDDGGSGGGEEGDAVEVELAPYVDEVAALVRTVLGMGEEGEGTDAAAASAEGFGAAASRFPPRDPRTGVVVLPSANAVVVTARPHMMRAVEREIDKYNAATARTVRLHVALYEVERRGGRERGVDLEVLREAAVGFGLRVSTGSTAGAGAVARVEFLEGNSADGSRAVLRWLETVGDVEVSLDDVVEVRNNAVAAVNTTETRQFVAQVSQQITAGGELLGGLLASTAPQVLFDELRLGWSLSLQPTIVGDRVTVRLALSRRALVEERPFSFGDGAVEGTNYVTDDFNRLMSVTLQDGETKMLTSLVNKSVRRNRRRVPWLGWLGRGGTESEREHEVVLVMKAEVL